MGREKASERDNRERYIDRDIVGRERASERDNVYMYNIIYIYIYKYI